MPDTTDFPVKWLSSEMPRAPVLRPQEGSIVALLDALLVTGWGTITAQRVTVEDGIATCSCNAGDTFVQHCVIEIAGADDAALNGQARVLGSTSTSFTFATSATDGVKTGTMTIKAAAAGWEKVFVGENKAVYRPRALDCPRFFYEVDDGVGGAWATVRGYHRMEALGEGVGTFPPQGTECRLYKAEQPRDWTLGYAFFADPCAVLMANEKKYYETDYSCTPLFFGTPAFGGLPQDGGLDAICAPAGWALTGGVFNCSGWVAAPSESAQQQAKQAVFSSFDQNFNLLGKTGNAMLLPAYFTVDGALAAFIPGIWLVQDALNITLTPAHTIATLAMDCGAQRPCLLLPTNTTRWINEVTAMCAIDILGPWR